MWNLLKNKDECQRLRDFLEEAAGRQVHPVNVDGLIESLPAAEQKHIAACGDCRKAAQELATVKELFRGVASVTEEERPWFAARVMAAIAARESELVQRVSAWSEFPRFASRFAWAATVVLLAGSTWFYESVVRAPSYPLNGATVQESIFEPAQPANQDDVLITMPENNL